MTTRGTVRENIKSQIGIAGTEYDSSLNLCIQEAIRLLEGKRYWFLRTIGQVALTAGASSVSVPADFSMMESADLLYSGRRYTHKCGFELWEYDAFKERFLRTTTLPSGRPLTCSLLNRVLYFSHGSDIDATVEFTYYKRDENELTSDADTSVYFGRDSMHVVRSIAKFIFEKEAWDDEGAKQDITAAYQQQLDRQHEIYERGSNW